MLVMLVALNAFLWTMTGFSLCWATHRQRGLEADRLDTVWPDTIPDWLADWVDTDPNGVCAKARVRSSPSRTDERLGSAGSGDSGHVSDVNVTEPHLNASGESTNHVSFGLGTCSASWSSYR